MIEGCFSCLVFTFNSYSSVVIKTDTNTSPAEQDGGAHRRSGLLLFTFGALFFKYFLYVYVWMYVFFPTVCRAEVTYSRQELLNRLKDSFDSRATALISANIDWLPPSGKLPPAFWGAIIICAVIIWLILYLFIKSFVFCLHISYTFLKKFTLKSTVFCSICTRYDCAIGGIDISVQLYTQTHLRTLTYLPMIISQWLCLEKSINNIKNCIRSSPSKKECGRYMIHQTWDDTSKHFLEQKQKKNFNSYKRTN